MSERPLVTCSLCRGSGEVQAPPTSFPADYTTSDVVTASDGIEVILMECPVCFGHGVREEATNE